MDQVFRLHNSVLLKEDPVPRPSLRTRLAVIALLHRKLLLREHFTSHSSHSSPHDTAFLLQGSGTKSPVPECSTLLQINSERQ
jgi:hypothetical protein